MDAVELGPFGLSQINYPAVIAGVKAKAVREKGEVTDQIAELTFALTVTPADFYRSPYFSCAFQEIETVGMLPAPGSHTDIDAEVANWQPAVKRRFLNEDWRVLPAAAVHATRITPDDEKKNPQPTAELTIVCEGLPHGLAGEAWYMNEWELHFEPVKKPEQLSIEPADDLVGIPATAVIAAAKPPEPSQATHDAEFERFWKLIEPAYDNLCQFAGGTITKDESKERFDYAIKDQGYLDLGSVAALTTPVELKARAKSDRNKADKFNLKGLAYVVEKHYGGSDGE